MSKVGTPQDNSIKELKDKIVELESRLNLFPEIVQSKTAEIIQRRFTDFTDSVSAKNLELIQRFGAFQNDLTKSLSDSSRKLSEDFTRFKESFQKGLTEDFDKLNLTVEKKLEAINVKVQENLNEGFKKTNETFGDVLQRLAKIDEAQKKIESLSTNVVSLQDILSDKKSRGVFGEVQLNQILFAVFGDKNDKVFQTQYTLSNSCRVDAILFAPKPMGNIGIDSKFPLENYRKMVDTTLPESVRQEAFKSFNSDVKIKIDEIADKYIIPNETADQAIMFLPAEAVFAELYAYHESLVTYAFSKRVWITSPTTFMAILSTLQTVLNDMERRKYADLIQKELNKLGEDFKRYRDRWTNLSKHIDTVQKDVKEIHTTTDKISNSFDKIAKVEIDNKPLIGSETEQPILLEGRD
ncbi:MAG: DNA recombination protein RmuC [Candidatus Marinimicrobia bacterium CG08_land_8_20_14_0_20_45_22]|nr:MAG: DNA recombination protein RmuC [Candidatus Marinimicrobia bacterium CG08_land_8_20_14_0_20_45_22]